MQTIEIIEGVTLTATEETLSWWEGQSEEEGNWEDQLFAEWYAEKQYQKIQKST